jgi:hypothetical protein
MSRKPPDCDRPENLADGWPDDPDNAELEALARRLREERPALSPEAMSRVRQRVRREMAPVRTRVLRRFAGLAAAAALLVATGLAWDYLFSGRGGEHPPWKPPAPRHVEATYELPLTAPRVRPPAGPLVNLGDYETLYEEAQLVKRN